jgi:hypothetical protein
MLQSTKIYTTHFDIPLLLSLCSPAVEHTQPTPAFRRHLKSSLPPRSGHHPSTTLPLNLAPYICNPHPFPYKGCVSIGTCVRVSVSGQKLRPRQANWLITTMERAMKRGQKHTLESNEIEAWYPRCSFARGHCSFPSHGAFSTSSSTCLAFRAQGLEFGLGGAFPISYTHLSSFVCVLSIQCSEFRVQGWEM